jgi:arsenite methyltransferase
MPQTKPQFGIDAPGVVFAFGMGGSLLLAAGLLGVMLNRPSLTSMGISMGCSSLASFLLMLLTSLLTKKIVVRRMIASVALAGNEQLLDVGCGRGLLLLEAAQQLPRGQANGLDLWSTRDQSGNAAAVTQRNARLAGVSGRVQIDTGDMRRMPYPDASFDVIISSLAIHNLPTQSDREQAVREIVRVLKPGGRLALLDFRHTGDYLRTLRRCGLADARRSWPNLLMFPCIWNVRASKHSG